MAKMKISFNNNVIPIYKLDAQTKKDIEDFYISVSNKIHVEVSRLQTTANKTTTDSLTLYRLRHLQESIDNNLREITGEIEKEITNNMYYISQTTVKKCLSAIKFELKEAYAHIPNQVIANIQTGRLYREDWTFSQAIWGIYNSTTGDVAKIVQMGMAQQKTAYEIAKDLEKYVDPNAKKPWDWSKVYPGVKKTIDYNAQRLARTMVSHAYQQSIIETAKINPWLNDYCIEWRSALVERTCEICEKRHGKRYTVNNIPLDHPNGLCTYILVFNKTSQQIADDIAGWIHGEKNSAIDNYATHLTGIDFSQLSSAQKSKQLGR